MAVAFSQEVVLPGVDGPGGHPTVPSPRALADLLARVLGDVARSARPSELRSRFESELRRLLGLRDVQIRETPVIPDAASESIYFTMPQSSGTKCILQVIFEPRAPPSEMEFRVLKAATTAAALVLEFAPLVEVSQPGLRILRA